MIKWAKEIGHRTRVEHELHTTDQHLRALMTASSEVMYRMNADWSEMATLDGRDFLADTVKPVRNWIDDMKHILLADDDTDDTELFCEAVMAVDPQVFCETVSDGSDVLAKLEDPAYSIPDVIILDINMPNVNGWTTLKAIRNKQRFADVPVFIYSTSSSDRDKQIAAQLGASGFFTKPERFEEIKKLVTGILAGVMHE